MEEGGGAGGESGGGPRGPGGDAVAATASREQCDRLVVAETDNEYRDCGGDGDVKAQPRMLAEREIGRLRPVIGRGQAVGPPPHPGQAPTQHQTLPRPTPVPP